MPRRHLGRGGNSRAIQLLHQLLHPGLHLVIQLVKILRIFHISQVDKLGSILLLVKNHQHPANHELPQKLILRHIQAPHPVKDSGSLVVEIPYRTAIGKGQLLVIKC